MAKHTVANGQNGHVERVNGDAIKEELEFPSLVEIKRVIPTQCFQPRVALAFYYAFKDVLIALALYGIFIALEQLPYTFLRIGYTPVYAFLQGTIMWSIFVVGHDCGHGSFSRSEWINNTVGNILHTALLVPYYPWKLSHHHHHKNTGNIDKDEIFHPIREKDWERDFTPIRPAFGFGLGWFAYLFVGYRPRKYSHFNPYADIFTGHSLQCFVSLGCIGAWLYFLLFYACWYGVLALVLHYVLPLMVFASWLVVVTFLHHNDAGVKWYADHKWTYVKGQLSSVDRDYGWAHDLTHNIGTHQIHHLFYRIPHYNLEEATRHFRQAFPQLTRRSDEPILKAFLRMFNLFEEQRHISNDTEIHVYEYKNK